MLRAIASIYRTIADNWSGQVCPREYIGAAGWGILGGSIGYAAGFITGFTVAEALLDFILGFVGFGAGSGLGSWFSLRRRLERAWRWPLASGLGCGIGGAVGILLVGTSGLADGVDAALGGGVVAVKLFTNPHL